MAKAAIGIDIGSTSVKVAQIKKAGQGFELEKIGFAPIYPSGDRPNDSASQGRAKVEAIRRALGDAKITVKNTVSAVSGESIIVRYLQLPKMPEDELKKALQWEAEEYIPFRLDEVNIDSMILGPNSYDQDKLDVLLVSAKKDLVNSHVGLLKEAGLSPVVVEVDSFAFLNAYDVNYGGSDCVALINIGADITGICIYHKGISRFSRDIPLGGNAMTEAVRSRMRCSFAEAEQLKIQHGAGAPLDPHQDTSKSFSGTSLMDTIRGTVEEMASYSSKSASSSDADGPPEQVVAKALSGVVGELVTEVRRSIEFFENQIRDLNVSRLILGGGSAVLKNLKENFEQDLSLPVEVIDPLKRINIGSKAGVNGNRHAMTVAIGLGIRGVNP